MEMTMTTIVIALLVVWYLGTTINAILANSGLLAQKEFSNFTREQDIRIHKARVKQHKAVEKFKDDAVYSDKEWDKIFNPEKED